MAFVTRREARQMAGFPHSTKPWRAAWKGTQAKHRMHCWPEGDYPGNPSGTLRVLTVLEQPPATGGPTRNNSLANVPDVFEEGASCLTQAIRPASTVPMPYA